MAEYIAARSMTLFRLICSRCSAAFARSEFRSVMNSMSFQSGSFAKPAYCSSCMGLPLSVDGRCENPHRTGLGGPAIFLKEA